MNETIKAHPDFETYTSEEIYSHKKQLEDDISFGTKNGADKLFITWLIQERHLCEAILTRRNGSAASIAKSTGRVQQQQESFWPTPLTAQQLIDLPPDPTRWVWFECLPLRSTSALVAKSYTGKSTFAASLSLCVARGWDFLGRPTQQGTVLYVYLDGPQDELKENLVTIGLTGNDPILSYAGRKPDRVLDWVKEICVGQKVTLLIVDTAQKFFGFKEDKYEEKINRMQPMLDLVNEYNFHAMFTYHAAKNAQNTVSALGSVASEANARVSLYLRKDEDTNLRVFDTAQNTGKRFEAIGLSDPNDGLITSQGSIFAIEIKQLSAMVLNELKETPGMQEADIRNVLNAKSKMLNIALRDMFNRKTIERTGMGRRGNPFKYFLAGDLINHQEEPPKGKVIDLFGNK